MEKRQVDLTGTSWSHAILPLMPPVLIEEDLRLFGEAARRILDYSPRGFFPPEMGISPLMPVSYRMQDTSGASSTVILSK